MGCDVVERHLEMYKPTKKISTRSKLDIIDMFMDKGFINILQTMTKYFCALLWPSYLRWHERGTKRGCWDFHIFKNTIFHSRVCVKFSFKKRRRSVSVVAVFELKWHIVGWQIVLKSLWVTWWAKTLHSGRVGKNGKKQTFGASANNLIWYGWAVWPDDSVSYSIFEHWQQLNLPNR